MELVNFFKYYKFYLFTAIIILWIYWLWTRRFWYLFSLKFPGYFGWPVIGVVLKFKSPKYFIKVIGEMYVKCKNYTICIWLGFYPVILTSDPVFIERVLTSPKLLNKAQPMYSAFYETFKGGIIVSPVLKWQHNRKLMSPSFQHKVLVNFFPIFNEAKDLLIKKINIFAGSEEEHQLYYVLQQQLLAVSWKTTMSFDFKDENLIEEVVPKIAYAQHLAINRASYAFLHLDFLYNFHIKFRKTINFLHDVTNKLIFQHMDLLNETIPENNNKNVSTIDGIKKQQNIFIDQALKLYQNKQFTWNDVASESYTIIAAAYETTSIGIYAALVLLAMHPAVQQRLYEEIQTIFPDKNFEFEYRHLEQLPYLDMVVNETLRLIPSVPLFARQVTEDIKLVDEFVIPKGVQIAISIFHLHRRKDLWGPNADKFNPDNFLPENVTKRHPFTFIPFSKGARNCIGWRYALFSMKLILTGLIRNYKFETNFKYEDLEFIENFAITFKQKPTFKIVSR